MTYSRSHGRQVGPYLYKFIVFFWEKTDGTAKGEAHIARRHVDEDDDGDQRLVLLPNLRAVENTEVKRVETALKEVGVPPALAAELVGSLESERKSYLGIPDVEDGPTIDNLIITAVYQDASGQLWRKCNSREAIRVNPHDLAITEGLPWIFNPQERVKLVPEARTAIATS